MSDEDLFEQARLFLPKYLAPEHQRQLFEELQAFPRNLNYYLSPDVVEAEFLQGDGWKGLVAIEFLMAERKAVSGVILSNSCDIDAENQRAMPVSYCLLR